MINNISGGHLIKLLLLAWLDLASSAWITDEGALVWKAKICFPLWRVPFYLLLTNDLTVTAPSSILEICFIRCLFHFPVLCKQYKQTHCNTVDDEASYTVPMSLSTKGFKFNVLHNSTDIARKKLGSASSLPPHFHVCLVLFIFNLCSYNFSVSQFSYCL